MRVQEKFEIDQSWSESVNSLIALPTSSTSQVSKRDETILSLQSELDATQQEFEHCNEELNQREQEVSELKGTVSKMEANIRQLKAEQNSSNEQVRGCLEGQQ